MPWLADVQDAVAMQGSSQRDRGCAMIWTTTVWQRPGCFCCWLLRLIGWCLDSSEQQLLSFDATCEQLCRTCAGIAVVPAGRPLANCEFGSRRIVAATYGDGGLTICRVVAGPICLGKAPGCWEDDACVDGCVEVPEAKERSTMMVLPNFLPFLTS